MNVFLAILFIASTGTGPIASSTHATLAVSPSAAITPWDAVLAYIDAHATQTDEITEGLLETEAKAGVATWVLFGVSGPSASLISAPLDGPGLGWPSAGRVITFATEMEATIAASMIMEITLAPPPPAPAPSALEQQTQRSVLYRS